MGEEIRKAPNIRFKGYEDEWEQRKLSDISDKVTEKNTENNYEETLTNSAEFGIISQKDFFDKEISNAKNLDGYYVVKNDDFVYNPRISNYAPVGPIKRNKLGRNGVMSPLYYVFRTHDIDRTYLEYYFGSTSWHNFMKLNGDSGARADRFAIKDSVLREMPIPYPTLEEQAKVGEFIDRLADLINLHQRKLDLLKVTKKSMLQKMFPKDGERVPEIRFAGFTDEWEPRKFRDNIVSIQTGTNLLGSIINTGMPLIKMGNIQRGYFSMDKIEYLSDQDKIESENIAQFGDFLFNTRNTLELVGKGATWTGESKKYAFNSNIARFKFKGIDTIFFNYLYNTENMIRQVNARATGTTSVAAIYPRNLYSIQYKLPSDEEQREIGLFFLGLDNLITLHQRELDLLKDLKKSMLQQMFI